MSRKMENPSKESDSNKIADELARQKLKLLESPFQTMLREQGKYQKNRSEKNPQTKILAVLEEKRDYLATELERTQFEITQSKKHYFSNLAKFLSEYETCKDEMANKRQHLRELETQALKLRGTIKRIISREMPPARQEIFRRAGKYEEQLQERHHNEIIKLETKIDKVDKLRYEIEHKILERENFAKHFAAMDADLRKGKKVIVDLIEEGTRACGNRKRAFSKLLSLKNETKRNLAARSLKAKKILQTSHNILRMNEFLYKKSQHREFLKLPSLDSSIASLPDQIADAAAEYQGGGESFEILSEKMEMEKLLPQVRRLGEENDNYYNFINDLNRKLNSMREEIKHLNVRINEERIINEGNKKELPRMTEALAREEECKRNHVIKAKQGLEIFKENANFLLTGIQDIFDSLECNSETLQKLLGFQGVINEENYEIYLKGLERRLLDLRFLAQYQKDYKTPQKQPPSALSHASSFHRVFRLPATPCPVCAEIEISEADESIVAPLQEKEVRESVRKQIESGERAYLMHGLTDCPKQNLRRSMQSDKPLD